MTTEDWTVALALVAIVVSVGTAVVGWQHAIRAQRATADANATAVQALELARQADERAQRIEDRDIERRDVRWELGKRREVGDRVTLTNIGTDTAYNVVMAVHPEGETRREERQAEIPPDGRIEVDVSDLAQARRDRAGRLSGNAVFVGTAVPLRVSVAWTSRTGVPDAYDFERINY